MKTIALVAHDARKQDMVEWANYNKEKLSNFRLVGTEGTAEAIKNITGLEVESLGHGPDGGDTYISYDVLEGRIDKIVFLIDVRTPHGHENDIQTLIRTCVLKNIPIALNRKTADFIISSKLMKN
ncbi:MAG: methylglyoxal synthase [bacterium]